MVIGGAGSNSTRQLVQLARERGIPAWQVQSAADLRPEWFEGRRSVGLSAGTSTLDETVNEVQAALMEIDNLEARAGS